MALRTQPADPQPGPLDLPTPVPVDGIVDLSPVVAAAWAAAGCEFRDLDREYWGDPSRAWEMRREAVATQLLVDWHGIAGTRDGYTCAAQGEIVTLANSPRHHCQARLLLAPRGIWLMTARCSFEHMPTRPGAYGIHVGAYGYVDVRPAHAYVDRATALRAAAARCLGDLRNGRGATYVRLIARLEAIRDGLRTEAA